MPSLEAIDLSLPCGNISSGGMVPFKGGREILETHQDHLKSLALGLVLDRVIGSAAHAFFSQEWCSVRLPHLSYLIICIPGVSISPELHIYIQQLSSSLIYLKIMHAPLSDYFGNSELESFCGILADFPYLQDLSLCLSNFKIGQLLVFANTLPHLLSLHIDYSCYQPDKRDLVSCL